MILIYEASAQFQSHIQMHHLCLSLIFKCIDSILISKVSTQSQSHFQNHQYSFSLIFIYIDLLLFSKAIIHSHYKNINAISYLKAEFQLSSNEKEDSIKLDSIYSCSLSIKMHLIRLRNIIIYILSGPSL